MIKLLGPIVAVATLILSGCAKQAPYDYTAFRASKPASILVLPAKNSSPDVNAAHSLVSVVTGPLAESGYYNNGVIGMLISAAVKQIASNISDKSHDIAILASASLLTADGRNGAILPGPRKKPVSTL